MGSAIDVCKEIVGLLQKVVDSSEKPASAPPKEEAKWLRICAFAAAYGYSSRSVSRWVKLGIPHIGNGHNTRINVARALVWLADDGPSKAARRLGIESHAKSLQ